MVDEEFPSRGELPPEAVSAGATRRILGAIQRGESDAWPRLLEHCEHKLRVRLHYQRSGRLRAVVAEDDLLQEVWLDAVRSIGAFRDRGVGSLHRWLTTILLHRISDAARFAARSAAMQEATASDSESDSASPASLLAALEQRGRGVLTSVAAHDSSKRVRDVLNLLPEEERQVLLFIVFEGLGVGEVASTLGVSEKVVRGRYKRGLAACACALRGQAS